MGEKKEKKVGRMAHEGPMSNLCPYFHDYFHNCSNFILFVMATMNQSEGFLSLKKSESEVLLDADLLLTLQLVM